MVICSKCQSDKITVDQHLEYYDIFKCSGCSYWTYKYLDDCCRNPILIVAVEHKNNNVRALFYQCLNCGGSFKNKPLSFKRYDKEIGAEFNLENYNAWQGSKCEEFSYLSEQKKVYNFFQSHRYKYERYIASDRWKRKRDSVLLRDNNLCQKCRVKTADAVHHITYDNVFNEPLQDLISVCDQCHKKLHHLN